MILRVSQNYLVDLTRSSARFPPPPQSFVATFPHSSHMQHRLSCVGVLPLVITQKAVLTL